MIFIDIIFAALMAMLWQYGYETLVIGVIVLFAMRGSIKR
jgi:hypothetical protein